MVHIYTFCDKTLVGRCENLSAKFLCENLFKLNLKIEDVSVFCNKYDYSSLSFKNKDIYFLLMQKTSNVLNSYLATLNGEDLKESSLLKQAIEKYYKDCNLPLENSSSLEWLIPSSAQAITNPNGKTQGYLTKVGDCVIFVLPNNINELKKIFNDCVLEYLENNYNIEHKSETFKTFGLTENYIKSILKDEIKNKDNISVSIFSKGLDNDVVIKSKQDNNKFDEYIQKVYNKLERYIYSLKDKKMSLIIEEEIKSQNLNFSFAGDFSVNGLLSEFSSSINKNINDGQFLTNKSAISSFLKKEIKEIDAEITYDVAVKLLEKSNNDVVFVSFYNLNESGVGESFIAIGNIKNIDIYRNKFAGTETEILTNISQTLMFYLLKRLKLKDLKTL